MDDFPQQRNLIETENRTTMWCDKSGAFLIVAKEHVTGNRIHQALRCWRLTFVTMILSWSIVFSLLW